MLCLFCLLAGPAAADFGTARLRALDEELRRLAGPYGQQVGICFIDLESGRELRLNATRPFPAASVAKLPAMAAVFHLAEIEALDLNKKILFREEDKLEGSGVLRWLKAGREYTLQNLTRLMIVLSDNTATKLVVEELGYERLNAYLRQKLGLKSTRVVDKTMLNEPTGEAVNLTTPADMARLVALIAGTKAFQPASADQMLGYMKNQRYRWGIWKGVPPGVTVANKTGNLDGVLNDVGVVYSPAGKYVLSVFTYGFAEQKTARELINRVSAAVYQAYTLQGDRISSLSGTTP